MPAFTAKCVLRLPATAFALLGVLVSVTTLAHSQSPLDMQERCASLARKGFEDFENEAKAIDNEARANHQTIGTWTSDYQSHYNTRLNKCLMLISRTGSALKAWVLVDAIERHVFAAYSELADTEIAKQAGRRWCLLEPSFRQSTRCKTREEFDAFVAEYMDE